MKQKTLFVRVVCIALALLLIAGLASSAFFAAYAADETPAQKLQRINQELAALAKEVAANKADVAKASDLKKNYQQQVELQTQRIAALQEQIDATQVSLDAKQADLAVKVQEVQDSQLLFEERLDAMYRRGAGNELETLLGVDSFADMLRAANDLQQISVSDIELITTLREQREELEAQRDAIQKDLDELDANKAELDAAKAELEVALKNANVQLSAAQAEQAASEEAYGDKAEEYKQAQKEWADWASSNGATNDEYLGGEYIWPVPGYYNISSGFGVVRYINGVKDVHRGIDIPAPAGTPIYAAAGGVVSTKNHWSYGVSVKVSCSTSMVNIYGHMTSRAAGITDGVVVLPGQLIGYVGSTGNSTGNHLHFEVDINSSPVSPWTYLKA